MTTKTETESRETW